MKITIYELLGLVKDGKAPGKIKYYDEFWRYNDVTEDYYNDSNREYLLKKIFCGSCMTSFIDDEVEIIEEDKKIKRIDFSTLNTQKEKNRVMKDTINQLIDEINNLKKND